MCFRTKVSMLLLALFIGAGVFSMSVQPAEAASLAELQQIIEQLKTQIAELQKRLTAIQQGKEDPGEWCHTFNKNLRIGDKGIDVRALRTALATQGFSGLEAMGGAYEFDERLASAVVGFQEKYTKEVLSQWGLKHGTGFVGKSTRAKLNKLYGCGIAPAPPVPPIPPVGECNTKCQAKGYDKGVCRDCADVPSAEWGCRTGELDIGRTSDCALPQGSVGTSWTARSAAKANSWTSVTYGNGLFVALTPSSDANQVMTSPDGVIWTARSAAEANSWTSVTYGNGLFVAVASSSGTDQVMTSPDGITWTARSAPEANNWLSITYGNGLFVAVAFTGENQVMTSPDGITWTARSAVKANGWTSATYGNGLFVAVAHDSTNQVMTSPDGITWTARSCSAVEADNWYSVTYGNGLFVAVAPSSGTDQVMTSPDGITWTARSAAEANSWRSVTYGNGLFVAVAHKGTNRVMTSPDGVIWTARLAAEANYWNSVTYGNGLFVAVASSGTKTNQVMTLATDKTCCCQKEAQEEPTPSITVIYPNGGEEWAVGQKYEIKWEQEGLGGEDIYIGLLIRNKKDGTLMPGDHYFSRGAVANQESYNWFITDWQVPEPDKYKYKIFIARKGEDITDMNIMDESDDYFSIIAAGTQTCTDTDGGKDYYVKGTLTFSTTAAGTGGIGTQDDVCIDGSVMAEYGSVLAEYYCDCDRESVELVNYTCPNGCADGACIIGAEPYCANIGTRSEGWVGDGISGIKYDNCDGCYAVCKAIGSKSEGWYSSCDGKLIKYAICEKPTEECAKQGEEVSPDQYQQGVRCCDGLKEITPERWLFPCDCPGINICGSNGCSIVPPYETPHFQCAPCGNGKCEFRYGENKCNCPEDCKETPSITVISPNGGEEWETGKEHDITWKSEGSHVHGVSIVLRDYSKTIDRDYLIAGPSISAESGKYTWIIYEDIIQTGDKYKIIIADGRDATIQNPLDGMCPFTDESDDYFSIVATGTQTCTDTDGGKDYYTKGTTKLNGQEKTDYCHYSYIEPEHTAHDSVIEYFCQSSNLIGEEKHYCQYGCSNGACKPGITVLSPNGGEKLVIGELYMITWDSSGLDNVTIEIGGYDENNNPIRQWHIISDNFYFVGTKGSVDWIVPSDIKEKFQTAPVKYKIRVRNVGLPISVSDESDDYFSIVAAGTSACTDSDGGIEKYVKGTTCRPSTVNDGLFCRTDRCIPLPDGYIGTGMRGYLTEYYCKDDKMFSKTIHCENGCANGACLEAQEECAKEGEQVNRNPLMGPTDRQCCEGLVENRVSKSYSICEKPTEEPTPSITVIYPNGGEELVIGETYDIRWEAKNVDKIMIQLNRDKKDPLLKESPGWHIAYSIPASLGSYSWTLGNYPIGHHYKMEIWNTSDTSIKDVSDDYFSIVATELSDCHTSPLWDWDYCSPDCKCNANEGDCDTDVECAEGLFCAKNVGANYGQDSRTDVCQKAQNTTY